MISAPTRHPHIYIEYTSEPPTPIGIDFFLPWLSGQQVTYTGRAELPTHWIFIRSQITETTGMYFIFTAKSPAMQIIQQSHSSAIITALYCPFSLSLTFAFLSSTFFLTQYLILHFYLLCFLCLGLSGCYTCASLSITSLCCAWVTGEVDSISSSSSSLLLFDQMGATL